MPLLTRRRFFGGLCLAGGGLVADMALIEPHRLQVGRHEVPLSQGTARRPLRVLQLSDFHASNCVSLDFIARSVQLGLSLEPDLICLTGDYITWRWEDWERYATILAALPRQAPTFACLGNHDGGRWAQKSRHDGYADSTAVRALLAQAGVTLLVNAASRLQVGDWALRIVGLSDIYNYEVDAPRAFAGEPPAGTTTLLLCHNPDGKTLAAGHAWQLMLCGHTHGGQCRLPFFQPPFCPIEDRRYIEGLNAWNDRWIHTTRGVGNLHGLRFNCPPEVSLLTLV